MSFILRKIGGGIIFAFKVQSLKEAQSIQCEQWIDRALGEDLHLPVSNVFIPTDLSFKNVSEQMKLPILLRKTPYSRLWYKPKRTFSTPNANVKIDFKCPYSRSSPESEVLTEIFMPCADGIACFITSF